MALVIGLTARFVSKFFRIAYVIALFRETLNTPPRFSLTTPPLYITVIYILSMFLIALWEDNGAKYERVVVMQFVQVGQVTDLTERWHAIDEGIPDLSLFAQNYVIN